MPVFDHPHRKKRRVFLSPDGHINQFVPIASCPVSGRCWQESGSLLSYEGRKAFFPRGLSGSAARLQRTSLWPEPELWDVWAVEERELSPHPALAPRRAAALAPAPAPAAPQAEGSSRSGKARSRQRA